jgi:uncharacterized protein (DUF362 family)
MIPEGLKPSYLKEWILWVFISRDVPVPLKNPAALRSSVYVPEAITRCDFLVNAPKFKIHAWLKVTFALKNLIDIQDDAYRLIDHDFTLT